MALNENHEYIVPIGENRSVQQYRRFVSYIHTPGESGNMYGSFRPSRILAETLLLSLRLLVAFYKPDENISRLVQVALLNEKEFNNWDARVGRSEAWQNSGMIFSRLFPTYKHPTDENQDTVTDPHYGNTTGGGMLSRTQAAWLPSSMLYDTDIPDDARGNVSSLTTAMDGSFIKQFNPPLYIPYNGGIGVQLARGGIGLVDSFSIVLDAIFLTASEYEDLIPYL